jgi:hypothetical protein
MKNPRHTNCPTLPLKENTLGFFLIKPSVNPKESIAFNPASKNSKLNTHQQNRLLLQPLAPGRPLSLLHFPSRSFLPSSSWTVQLPATAPAQ